MFDNLFKSKEEAEKNFNDYKNKMFPFGETQKDLVSGLLTALISNKAKESEIMFYFLISKEKYIDKGESAIEYLQKYIIKGKLFKKHEANLIISCAILDSKVTSLNEYFTKENILEMASKF